jgi:hypothetical protein
MSLEDIPEWALRQLSIAEVIGLQSIQSDSIEFIEWSHGYNKSYSIDIGIDNNDTSTLEKMGWERQLVSSRTIHFWVVSKWLQR